MQIYKRLTEIVLLAGVLSTVIQIPGIEIARWRFASAQSNNFPDASVNGKYSDLIQTVNCPSDSTTYGEFYEWGYWGGTSWCGQTTQPGYWVWVEPNWHIWRNVGTSRPTNSPSSDASVNGKYSDLIQTVNCPSDSTTYGEFYEWGYWGGTSWCGQTTQPGYWVWVEPNWHIWENLAVAEQPETSGTNSPQQESAQQPCNDNQLPIDFDTSSYWYHSYEVENEICAIDPSNCTKSFVFEKMISQVQFIAPTSETTPVENCRITNLDIPYIPAGDDPIRTVVNHGQYSITNYTRKDHALYPGRVTRTVLERNGKVFVSTFGEGIGIFPGWNESLAPDLWTEVDNRLVEAMR